MARRVFFSFHYDRDIFRVNVVRNSGVFRDIDASGFYDASIWGRAKSLGEAAVKRLIDNSLEGTSVTVVLIGAETAERPYVKYEIEQSYHRGNGLLGIYIHNIKDQMRMYDGKGTNPFASYYVQNEYGVRRNLADIASTYDWVNDDGYNNLGDWVEAAASKWGR